MSETHRNFLTPIKRSVVGPQSTGMAALPESVAEKDCHHNPWIAAIQFNGSSRLKSLT